VGAGSLLLQRIAILVVLLSVTLSMPAWTSSVDKYVALRKDLGVTNRSLPTVAASPSEFVGKVVEIRGSVTGVVSGDGGGRLILASSSGQHYILSCDTLPDLPTGQPKIAVLALVGEGSSVGLSDLRLVDWCFEWELRAREDAEARRVSAAKPAGIQTSQRPPARKEKRPTSRGYSLRDIFSAYRRAIASFNPRLSSSQVDRITNAILTFSARYGVDPRLVVAVVLAESRFRPWATSPKGAMGLGQLMPGTARGLGVQNPYDPEENLAAAIRLIRSHLDKMSGKAAYGELTWSDLALALACYNAGPGAVKKYGGVPPYRETQGYIRRVITYYKRLCGVRED